MRAPHSAVGEFVGGYEMRFRLLLALLMGLSVFASAQQRHKPITKSSVDEKGKARSGSVKMPTQKSATSLELKKLEQQTAKSADARKRAGRQHIAPVKVERDRVNPSIRFGAADKGAGSGGKSGKGGGKNRVRGKGRH